MRRRSILPDMQSICKCKIGSHSSSASHTYPVMRLPREFKELIGRQAHISVTETKDKTAFLVTVPILVDNYCTNSENGDTSCRLSALESQIADLKNIFSMKESGSNSKKENQMPRARFEPTSWPPQGRCLYTPCKRAIKRLLISVAEQGRSGTLAFPGFITT
jgi:hypothetical protein